MKGRCLGLRLALALGVLGHVAPAAAQAPVSDPQDRWTLAQAVRAALEAHPSIEVAASRAVAANAEVGEALATRWPQLAFQANATRFEEPMIVAPLHGFDLTSPPAFDRALLQGKVLLQYTLFDGGERGGRVGGARAQADAAAAEEEASRLSATADVARRYLAVLTAAGVVAAQEEGVAALRAESLRVTQMVAEGRAPRVELLRVQAALAGTRAELTAARERLTTAERGLARHMGVDPARVRSDQLHGVGLAARPPDERGALLARVEHANPKLEAARRRVTAARRAHQSAVAQWFPQVDLVGGYQGFGAASGDFVAEWQAGVRVSYPLFAGGGRANAVRRAGAEADAAQARYDAASRELADAVDHALATAREARARVEAGQAAVEYLNEVVRIEQLRVTTGSGTETDYLRAEADARRAAAELVEARHAEIASHIELARLTGELSVAWLANALENEQ